MSILDNEKQLQTTIKAVLLTIAGLIALCVVLLFVLLCVKGCNGCAGSQTPDDTTPTDTQSTSPVVNPGGQDNVTLPETPDAGIGYQDTLTFVGDSLTAHLVSRGVLSDGTNTRQVWKTQTNMMNLNSEIDKVKVALPGTGTYVTIADAAAQVKPAILIITLGTDYGVSYLTEEEFKSAYTKLIKGVQEKSPATRIILQSIFPVTDGCKVLSNEKIDKCNVWVKEIAASNGCRYLDTQSVLKDNRNNLKDNYCSSEDGIHLTADAYKVILQYIRTHALTE